MITVKNYQDQKNNVAWSKMPKAVQDTRTDVEEIMEFYDDDADIKETVDIFLKQINDNSKPVGEIIVAKLPKVLHNPNVKKETFEKAEKAVKKVKSQQKNPTKYDFERIAQGVYKIDGVKVDLTKAEFDEKHPLLILRYGSQQWLESLKEYSMKPTTVSKEPLVIYWEGKYITRKTLQSDYSFTENENLAYTWKESERSALEKTAKIYDGLVITMSEAKKLTDLMIASNANREKTYPSKAKKETPTDNAKKLGQLLYEYTNLSNRMVKVMSSSKSVAETLTYDQLNDKLQKTVTEISYLIDGNYSEAREYIKEWVTKNGSLFVFEGKKYLEAAKQAYNIEKKPKTPAKPKSEPAKAKVAKVIDKKFVDNFSTEFQLIRRFWNIIKDKNIEIPFRKTQLLFMAFNKAAIERKVRKTSEVADIFNQCNEKMRILFEEFAKPTQAPIKVTEFSDQKLFKEIEDYVSDVAINPAVSVLKRFIAIQNTTPDVKKAESIKKALERVLANDTNNRLSNELKDAVKWINDYIKKPSTPVETEVYGLSVPKVCKNRVKCTGIDKTGKLHKGYKFQEHTGNVIKVRKGKLGSPNVCDNRVKCTGLSKNGKLLKGYKFEEGTNKVVKVRKVAAKKQATKKAPIKKKVVAGLGFSGEIEKVYFENTLVPVVPNFDYSTLDPTGNNNPPPKAEPTPEPIQPPVVKNKLMNMQFDSLQMDEGWENFMQNPAKTLKIGIKGEPKNGKTAGSLQLANYITKFGNVLYNFADQGFNKSTQDLWRLSGLAQNSKATPSDITTLDELEKEIKTGKYTYVFIDMINDYIDREKITPQEFKDRFILKYPKVGFILVFEVTKAGDFKGDKKWMHVVDAIATVSNFLMEIRGRYGDGYHIVWEEGFKKYDPKRYEEVMDELQPVDLAFNEVEKI